MYVFHVQSELSLILTVNVKFLILFVKDLYLQLKDVNNVIQDLLWIQLKMFVLKLLLQTLILTARPLEMVNANIAHSDILNHPSMENANKLIPLAVFIHPLQVSAQDAMMVIN